MHKLWSDQPDSSRGCKDGRISLLINQNQLYSPLAVPFQTSSVSFDAVNQRVCVLHGCGVSLTSRSTCVAKNCVWRVSLCVDILTRALTSNNLWRQRREKHTYKIIVRSDVFFVKVKFHTNPVKYAHGLNKFWFCEKFAMCVGCRRRGAQKKGEITSPVLRPANQRPFRPKHFRRFAKQYLRKISAPKMLAQHSFA